MNGLLKVQSSTLISLYLNLTKPNGRRGKGVTNYDYVQRKQPEYINKHAIGGVIGCPADYGLPNSLRKEEYCKEDCTKCWQLPVSERKQ